MTYIKELKKIFTGGGNDNTSEGALIRSGGKHISKTITLSANATSANVNVFQITGTVNVKGLHGEVVAVTTLNNCTSVYFDLWDGTTSTAITKTTGANMNGFGVGSFFIKDASNSTELSTINNDQARIKEAATGARVYTEFLATQKISTTTYIRFNYTTTDAPINAQIKIDLVFADIDSGDVTAV